MLGAKDPFIPSRPIVALVSPPMSKNRISSWSNERLKRLHLAGGNGGTTFNLRNVAVLPKEIEIAFVR
ncbi:MAG TPA: hypothetical protein VLV18_11430 [Terriglobales bacterium]|nr:hypothetical protein [Terriglobales bacterium]